MPEHSQIPPPYFRDYYYVCNRRVKPASDVWVSENFDTIGN